MKVIALNRLKDAQARYPAAAEALEGWFQVMNFSDFPSDLHLRRTFGDVDAFNQQYTFKVPGTALALTATINFPAQVALVKDIRPGTTFRGRQL